MTSPESTVGVHGRASVLSSMRARDPDEPHRTVSGLELLFDLAFVAAFAKVSAESANGLADGQFMGASVAYFTSLLLIIWTWLNYTWFASAYDNDDWLHRATTAITMLGVVVMTVGVPSFFSSTSHGEALKNNTFVIGLMLARFSLGFNWLRAARANNARRNTCITYAFGLGGLTFAWFAWGIFEVGVGASFCLALVIMCAELLLPVMAERFGGTQLHVQHLAERFGLIVVVALGECVIGTVSVVAALVDDEQWTVAAALLLGGGIILAFTLWWLYFSIPTNSEMKEDRAHPTAFTYGHLGLLVCIVAIGVGLHLAGSFIDRKSQLSSVMTMTTIYIPIALFVALLRLLYGSVLRGGKIGAMPYAASGFLLMCSLGVSFFDQVGPAVIVSACALVPLIVSLGFGRSTEAT